MCIWAKWGAYVIYESNTLKKMFVATDREKRFVILLLLSLLASGCQIQARLTKVTKQQLSLEQWTSSSLSLSFSTEGFSLREARSTLSQGRLY